MPSNIGMNWRIDGAAQRFFKSLFEVETALGITFPEHPTADIKRSNEHLQNALTYEWLADIMEQIETAVETP